MRKKTTALAAAAVIIMHLTVACKSETRPYLDAAEQAASWIRRAAVSSEPGTAWPAVPGNPDSVTFDLYSGIPGIILFFLEAHSSTGKEEYLSEARSAADLLLSHISLERGAGLYTGLSGIAFVLEEVHKVSGDSKYRRGFLDALKKIEDSSVREGRGVEWSPTTDIISGNSGIGLLLLYAYRETSEKKWLDLAAEAGKRLIELGKPEEEGVNWAMHPEYPRSMPNFSHGTAGIAYFLSSLYLETGDEEYLRAALAGARYLLDIAETGGDACLIFHHEPGGEDLYYLGWCHGPVGTARLFFRLYEATGEESWLDWVRKSANAIQNSGIPEVETPGFWNNSGICCGLAGVGEFFLDLAGVLGDKSYLEFACRVTSVLLEKASVGNGEISWLQAEHRTRPEFLQAQTGYMQGAAGIGMFLLHLDAAEKGRRGIIVLPDSPFGY